MTRVLRFPLDEARPARDDVLAAQGLPAREGLAPRLRALLDDALALFDDLAEPRAVTTPIGEEDFARVIDGLALPPEQTVVGIVFPRARHHSLFVATLGEPVCRRIATLFAGNDLALGWMLDAVCSAAADRLSLRLAARFEEECGRDDGVRALPYSPGYCGWTVRGQRRLFAATDPSAIGVTLNDSCLMSPIKSVSGVLLAGPKEIHRFRPDFPFCDECRNRTCGWRMATVLRS
jgi:hypothetical protein